MFMLSCAAGSIVETVKATDADGGAIVYELTSSSADGADLFFLSPSSGEIRTLQNMQGATQTSYVVSSLHSHSSFSPLAKLCTRLYVCSSVCTYTLRLLSLF